MKRSRLLLIAAGFVLAVGCTETKTPTEPASFVAPTPTPSPTGIAGQPASLSGSVGSYGPLEPGTTVECQGKSTTTAADGTFILSGLLSGSTQVKVTYSYRTSSGVISAEDEIVTIVLQPGANTVTLTVY